MEKSVMIYDGDRLVMELIAVEERNYTLYAIKKGDSKRGITRRTFLMYIDIARTIGYTVCDHTDS